jgi:pSer/pThr/pTyr-binding forkhead associated (FHA) protein
MREGESLRIQRLQAVLDHLDPGVYLVGAGPYTQGVYSLMYDEIVVGRLATVLEKPLDQAVDVFVNDATCLTPREVSRVHCAIYRREGVTKHDYWLIDRGSTCGTFLNDVKLEPPKSEDPDEVYRVSRSLSDGDLISLGPSLVNTFIFADLRV